MLNVNNPEIFTDAHSIKLTPIVSAEWNQNLFTPPYLTVAGDGTKKTLGTVSGTITDADVEKPNFTTKQFTVASGSSGISYPVSTGLGEYAYKVVTHIRTNTSYPVLINTSLFGSESYQSGSASTEVDSFKWTKIETYIGSDDAIDTLEYNINATILVAAGDSIPAYDVYFTVPEVYETTLFDYKYNSLWPTDAPFKFFRPGESYVKTGNDAIDLPANYRRVATKIGNTESLSGGYYGDKYMPISPICYNPGFAIMETPQSVIIKNGLPTNLMPYQYFVSDTSSKILTGIYEKDIYVNKIVIKFNKILTTPSAVVITIDDIELTPVTPYTPNSNGILTLYWTGSAWSTTEWASMPIFNDSALISKYTTINKITVETTEAQSTAFSASKYNAIDSESSRMQIIEISPRLEVDVSNLTQAVSINKSLDAKNSQVPIASLNSNDASITLSGIPTFIAPDDIVPIFSNQSNYLKTMLKGMLTRNVKFYINFYANYAFDGDIGGTQYPSYNTYIPGGIFYSDSWLEKDIDTIDVQLFDTVRYLQSTQVPDYVANIKPIFDIITNIMDLSGFTDYDYDSLYNACNNKTTPMDVSYYYCNSRDKTIADALSEIFLAYQIGAYIDEYGVMQFLSLSDILNPNLINSSLNTEIITLEDKDIIEGGYSVSNKQKPGKISIRYQQPQIKQSASLQNITNADIKNSPSFVLTTSNDVNWTQEQLDSVGFNYLNEDMLKNDSSFKLDINDLLNIFTTYSLNFSGYAAIEDEVVSLKYKEYNISKPSTPGASITVSVKNDLELTSYINKFTKDYSVGLQQSNNQFSTTSNSVSGGSKTFTLSNTDGFSKYGRANVRQVTTSSYSSGGAAGSTSFVISAVNTNIKVGQKIVGTGFSEGSVVRSISGTTINFYPEATAQISGTVSFVYVDQYMSGYINSVTPTSISLTVDSFNGTNTASSWYISNIPNYDILVEPTGYITHVDRGVFNTKVSDHSIIGTSLSDKDMSEATIEYTAGPPSSYSINTSSTNAEGSSGKIITATPANKKVLIYPTTERDLGYQTYSTKFSFIDNPIGDVCVGGLFFNFDSTLTTDENAYFVELSQYRNSAIDPWKYMVVIYRVTSSEDREIIAHADVTYIAQLVLQFFPNVHVRNTVPGDDKYAVATDSYWHLKVVHQSEQAADGNVKADGDKTISVYLNNIEISNWEVAGIYSDKILHTSTSSETIASSGTISIDVSGQVVLEEFDRIYLVSQTSPSNYMFGQISSITYSGGISTINIGVTSSSGSGTFSSWNIYNEFEPQRINHVTGLRKKIDLPYSVTEGTIFGIVASTMMAADMLLTYPPSGSEDIFEVRELYATQTPLIGASINYHYQNRNFLNNTILGQRNVEKTYCMQTSPEIVGINYYDVEYDSPAAINSDVYPVEYNWHYFPGGQIDDQKYRQVLTVFDHAVAYSTVVNTGFRGKFMIANNSPHVVYLNKDSDDLNQFNIRLNVWTHEIIAQSAQENIEKIVDIFNSSETIQIDSEWLQSRDAAERMASTVAAAIDPFSKEISLEIFGNPIIQVGDIVNLIYNLKGIRSQKCLVKSVSHSFDNGLSTSLMLATLNNGIDYTGESINTISYNGNNNTSGTAPTDSNTYAFGSTATVLAPTGLSRSNFTFSSWNTAADGSGISYNVGDTINIIGENITLYAQWAFAARYFILKPLTLRNAGNYLQLSEFHILNNSTRISSATYVNWDLNFSPAGDAGNGNSPGGQFPSVANDNNTGTTWLDFRGIGGGLFIDTGLIQNVTGYRWYTGGDFPQRDMTEWTIYASSDNSNWIVVDEVSGFSPTTSRTTLAGTWNFDIPTSQPTQISSNGIVLHLDANNSLSYPGTGTTWYDLSPLGRNATLVNGVSYISEDGGKFYFDGVNDHMTLAPFIQDFSSGITIGFVADFEVGESYERLLDFGNGQAADNILFNRTSTGTNIEFSLFNGSTQNYAIANAIVNTQRRYYTAVADGQNYIIYRDGLEIARSSNTFLPSNIIRTLNYIGRPNWPGPYYAGTMSHIHIYNRALSGSEVFQNFNILKNTYQMPVTTVSGAISTVPNSVTGLLKRRYDQGYHNDDPTWFDAKTPNSSGADTTLSITTNADNYSILWTGYFIPPTTGLYKFATYSDDGSWIWIGNSAKSGYRQGNSAVNAGGTSSRPPLVGGVWPSYQSWELTSGQCYPIRIMYGELGGGDIMTAYYQLNNSGTWISNNWAATTQYNGSSSDGF